MTRKKYMPKHLMREKNTPQVDGRQNEHVIARRLKGGRTAINSGATFGQNDILAEVEEVEAKLTTKNSFSLKADYLRQVKKKCDVKKIPLMVVTFQAYEDSYAVVPFDDYTMLMETLQELKNEVSDLKSSPKK